MNHSMDKDISEFYLKYDINEEIGEGRFSVVKRCTARGNRQSFAMKISKKTQTNENYNKYLKKEIEILRRLEHRNIVRFHDCYTDINQIFLIIDFLSGGDLFEELTKRSYYTERDASVCIQQILEAVDHCHDRGIIHRDLKPENLLLASQTKGIWIKIVDFGLAVQLDRYDKFWYGFAGTLSYLSPEMINREEYGKGIDIWACGVILYILLCGYPPFANEDQRELFGSITSGKYEFHSPEWDTVTLKAKDIIRSMLTLNQDKRPTASQLLTRPWISERNHIASSENREETIGAMRRFIAKRKLKSSVQNIMAINRLSIDTGGQKTYSATQANSISQSPMRIIPYAVSNSDKLSVDTALEKTEHTLVSEQILDLTRKLINTPANGGMLCHKSTEFLPGIPCIVYEKDKPLNQPTTTAQAHTHSILQPTFHILSQEAVCIAYIRVCSGQNDSSIQCSLHTNVKSYKETRVWQKIGANWVCLHCHSSEI